MDQLIFSQAAVFRLQQLANRVCQQTGTRYKLSDTAGIVSLLRESEQSQSRDIRLYYEAFVMELNKRQLDSLRIHGISMLPLSQNLRLRQQH